MPKRKRRTKRIYHGPQGKETSMYWVVDVSDAKQDVVINGSAVHALKAARGQTIGCAMSKVAADNRDAFPHPVILIAFEKSVAYVVDRVNAEGQPCHAVKYAHSYGSLTEKNDTGALKRLAARKPEVMSRSFTLRKPQKSRKAKVSPPTGEHRVDGTAAPKPRGGVSVHRGAMRRAVKAGLVHKEAAKQITQAIG